MLDPETFLTEVYVMVDDFAHTELPPERHPGRRAGLSRSEIITLALFGQWSRFRHEADFYRYAAHRLRAAFPGLPSRCQLNRLVRQHRDAITHFGHWLATQLGAHDAAYEVLDSTGVRTRNVKRRHHGWLFGQTDLGYCTRLGFYHGFQLLTAVTPTGVITGYGFGPASTNDRVLAETFFAVRATPDARLPSVGPPAASGDYVADMGFGGRECEARWVSRYGAYVTCAPQPDRKTRRWPKPLRRWLASIRQVIETVHDHLLETFRLERERPHDVTGFQARLAAKMALHNVCIWLNRQLGRPDLAIAEVLAWD